MKNQWAVLYVDDCGERQVVKFDTFEQANQYLVSIRNCGACVIGVMTTAFYENCVKEA